MQGRIDSIQVWGRTVYKGKQAVYKENRQYMVGGQTVCEKGTDSKYEESLSICVFPPTYFPNIWFCSTTFQMTHAKCKIIGMAMMDMDSMRNILIEMWDNFIYLIIMCKYVL